jgi:fucose 4-O-acetylase-like acetyltransferase
MHILLPLNRTISSQSVQVQWIDIAKGIGIILVVIGHFINNKYFGGLKEYIYWFHMPLFFIISGMLYRQRKSFSNFAAKRFKQLLIPYCCFLTLAFISHLFGYYHVNKAPLDFILGGGYLKGVYWFISCLFFTQLAASLIIQ